MQLKEKRGSVVLFLSILFSALVILIFAFIDSAIDKGIDSGIENLGKVWGIDILSEYDIHLYEDYGLLAYFGSDYYTSEKLNYYVKASLNDKWYIKYQGTKVSLQEYRLSNLDVLKGAIHKAIFLKDGKGSKATTIAFAREKFNSHRQEINSKAKGKHEIEYLICGKNFDDENYKAIKKKYVLSRIIPNSAYIYSSPRLMEETFALASVLTPGPAATATQIALIETWATVESENDWKIIEDGGKVPLVKTKESWALDIGVLSEDNKPGYVKMNNKTGLNYTEYLDVLLIESNEKVLLKRMMNLIETNMKHNYYDAFSFNEYYVGLDYFVKVNNEEHEFIEKY